MTPKPLTVNHWIISIMVIGGLSFTFVQLVSSSPWPFIAVGALLVIISFLLPRSVVKDEYALMRKTAGSAESLAKRPESMIETPSQNESHISRHEVMITPEKPSAPPSAHASEPVNNAVDEISLERRKDNVLTSVDQLNANLAAYLRAMGKMLDSFEPRTHNTKHEGFYSRISRLRFIHSEVDEIAESMLHVNAIRNRVVKDGKTISLAEQQSLAYSWQAIEAWYTDVSAGH